MAKILVADKLAQEGVDILKESKFDVDIKTGLAPQELKEVIKDYDAVIVRSQTKLTEDIIMAASNLKVIGRAGVGLDNIDITAATKKGVIVMNAPGGNTISTCEHTFALILSLARKVPFGHASLKKGEWNRSKFKGIELYSKTLGIVGFGRIGKEVAKRARAFGMKVLVYDPFIAQDVVEKLEVKSVKLDELLKESDIVTVHTPLTADTKGLISKNEFSIMKKSSFIVNCARGGIIDEEALFEALSSKRIAGAALDVFVKEPPDNAKLIEMDNLVVTPHLGASTQEAQLNVAIEISHCIKDALLGKAIRNSINYVQMEPEVYKMVYPYISLSEKMGRFLSQIIEGGTEEIKISYIGEIASFKVDPLAMAFTKGFLSPVLEENINYINAMGIAKERGIKIEQVKLSHEEEYVNSIRVSIKTDKEERMLEGTLFANREPRFVKMDDVYIEVAPSDYMVVINNKDRPGVIGSLGTILGSHNVNISNMSLGKRKSDGTAITVLNVDASLEKSVISDIVSNSNIISLKFIVLGG